MPYKDKEDKKQYMKQYRENNADKIRESKKQYRENNADKIRESNKQYRQDHKEEIRIRKNRKTNCDCGGKYIEKHKARHMRTSIHQDWIQTKHIEKN